MVIKNKVKHDDIAVIRRYKNKHIKERLLTYYTIEESTAEKDTYYLFQNVKLFWYVILFIPLAITYFFYYGINGVREDFPLEQNICIGVISKNQCNPFAYEYLKEKGYIK